MAEGIKLNGEQSVYIAKGEVYTDEGAYLILNNSSLSLQGKPHNIDTNKVGAYMIKYSFMNETHIYESTRTVHVRERPIITLNGPELVCFAKDAEYKDFGAKVNGEENKGIKVSPESIDTSSTRLYAVTYDFEDENGVKAETIKRRVRIIPNKYKTTVKINDQTFNDDLFKSNIKRIDPNVDSFTLEKIEKIVKKKKNNDDKVKRIKVEHIDLLDPSRYIQTFQTSNSDNTQSHIIKRVVDIEEDETASTIDEYIFLDQNSENNLTKRLNEIKAKNKHIVECKTEGGFDKSEEGVYYIIANFTNKKDKTIKTLTIKLVVINEFEIWQDEEYDNDSIVNLIKSQKSSCNDPIVKVETNGLPDTSKPRDYLVEYVIYTKDQEEFLFQDIIKRKVKVKSISFTDEPVGNTVSTCPFAKEENKPKEKKAVDRIKISCEHRSDLGESNRIFLVPDVDEGLLHPAYSEKLTIEWIGQEKNIPEYIKYRSAEGGTFYAKKEGTTFTLKLLVRPRRALGKKSWFETLVTKRQYMDYTILTVPKGRMPINVRVCNPIEVKIQYGSNVSFGEFGGGDTYLVGDKYRSYEVSTKDAKGNNTQLHQELDTGALSSTKDNTSAEKYAGDKFKNGGGIAQDVKNEDQNHLQNIRELTVYVNGTRLQYDCIVSSWLRIIDHFKTVFTIAKHVQNYAPVLGFYVKFDVQFLDGSIALQWGWIEDPYSSNALWLYQVKLEIIVIGGYIEIGFGVSIIIAKAQAYIQFKGTISSSLEFSASTNVSPKLYEDKFNEHLSTFDIKGTIEGILGFRFDVMLLVYFDINASIGLTAGYKVAYGSKGFSSNTELSWTGVKGELTFSIGLGGLIAYKKEKTFVKGGPLTKSKDKPDIDKIKKVFEESFNAHKGHREVKFERYKKNPSRLASKTKSVDESVIAEELALEGRNIEFIDWDNVNSAIASKVRLDLENIYFDKFSDAIDEIKSLTMEYDSKIESLEETMREITESERLLMLKQRRSVLEEEKNQLAELNHTEGKKSVTAKNEEDIESCDLAILREELNLSIPKIDDIKMLQGVLEERKKKLKIEKMGIDSEARSYDARFVNYQFYIEVIEEEIYQTNVKLLDVEASIKEYYIKKKHWYENEIFPAGKPRMNAFMKVDDLEIRIGTSKKKIKEFESEIKSFMKQYNVLIYKDEFDNYLESKYMDTLWNFRDKHKKALSAHEDDFILGNDPDIISVELGDPEEDSEIFGNLFNE